MKKLLFDNGYGGFDFENNDYIINNIKTPSPWCNVLANPEFGTLISQSGASYTWFGDSTLYRISPKLDDVLLELSGEKIYLKNETTGKIWEPYLAAKQIRHSRGFSIFESASDLDSEITVFVAPKKPIKIVKLKVRNSLEQATAFSATYYLQPVLGDFVEKTKADILTGFDENSKMIYIKNPGSFFYPRTLVYLGTNEKNISYTLDRTEFLGKDFQLVPYGLKEKELSSKNISANDPAAVIKANFTLEKNEERIIYFYLGVTENGILNNKEIKFVEEKTANMELAQVSKYWKNLPVFEIKTPNDALDILINSWLLYQTISSRIWGKTGFWQPSGAFGFRDLLQDIMALVWSEPTTVKQYILLAASKQFTAGDVQHWWHPTRGDGIRSTSSDVALWLVYSLNFYLEVTEDEKILDERVAYLHSSHKNHRLGSYFVPEPSKEKDTLYSHCTAIIDRSLSFMGAHGLPLIFSGDWNDSLSEVGIGKKGESVWTAQFLGKILKDFIPKCEKRSDQKRVKIYKEALKRLESSLEKSWDGNWYKRAFWDDGTALGSASNELCRIDGLTQNWSVISEMGSKERAKKSMQSLEENLIDWQNKEVRLLTPPFSQKSDHDPGYIMTYPPGTRENGSTYSHNAIWSASAFALLGEGNKAMQVLDILNPILRTETENQAELYRGEPYVIASDIYTEGSYCGRAGWTWYTGSAANYYKTVIENIFGIQIRKNKMTLNPCVPSNWHEFSVSYRYGATMYQLHYENPEAVESGVTQILLDNKEASEVLLKDDKQEHKVTITMG